MVDKSVWKNLKRPITALAPMEDVTDSVFRQIVASCGAPDLFFTEFVNCEGLFSKGREKVIHRLQFTPQEKPIIAQIWGKDPENFYKTAQLIAKMGFDGIDINMGCPQKKVVSHGSCAALIKNKPLVKEMIKATQEGSKGLPVSVKTRIGIQEIETESWISFLLEQNLDALIIHGRTVKEMSSVPTHWDEIGKAVLLRNKIAPETIVLGNGDIMSLEEVAAKVKKYKVDGVMIGRGVFSNPWVFNPAIDYNEVTVAEKLQLLIKHLDLFIETWNDIKDFAIMRKFVKVYVNNFPDASKFRAKLMEQESLTEIKKLVQNYSNTVI